MTVIYLSSKVKSITKFNCEFPAKDSSDLLLQGYNGRTVTIGEEENNVLVAGQPFLCGNQFTAVDSTFAALAGFIKSQWKNFWQRWLNSLFH